MGYWILEVKAIGMKAASRDQGAGRSCVLNFDSWLRQAPGRRERVVVPQAASQLFP